MEDTRYYEGVMSHEFYSWLTMAAESPKSCFYWDDGLYEADPIPTHKRYGRWHIADGESCTVEIHPGAITLCPSDPKFLFRCWHTGKNLVAPSWLKPVQSSAEKRRNTIGQKKSIQRG